MLKLHLLDFDALDVFDAVDAVEFAESVDEVLVLLRCEMFEFLLVVVAYELTDSACEPKKLYLLPPLACLLPKTFFKDNVEPDFSLMFVLCKLCDL